MRLVYYKHIDQQCSPRTWCAQNKNSFSHSLNTFLALPSATSPLFKIIIMINSNSNKIVFSYIRNYKKYFNKPSYIVQLICQKNIEMKNNEPVITYNHMEDEKIIYQMPRQPQQISVFELAMFIIEEVLAFILLLSMIFLL